MKKALFGLLAAVALLTGCGNSSPEYPVFGEGTEYRLLELSFKTDSEVQWYGANEIRIADGDFGYMTITYTEIEEDVSSPMDDISHIAELQNSLQEAYMYNEDAELTSEQNEGTAKIDGLSVDTALCYLNISLPDDEDHFRQYVEMAKFSTERFSYSISYAGYVDNGLSFNEHKERAKNIYHGIEIEPVPVTEHSDFTDDWSDIAAEKPLPTDKRHYFQNGLTFMLPEEYASETDSPFDDTTYVCSDMLGSLSFVNNLPLPSDNYIRCYDELDHIHSLASFAPSEIHDLRRITVNGIEMVYISAEEKDALILGGNGKDDYYHISIDNTCERDLTSLILNSISFEEEKLSPDGSLLGRGASYNCGALSFRTELDVSESASSTGVRDKNYDGSFAVYCEEYAPEDIPSFQDQYQGLINNYMDFDGFQEGWTADYTLDEKTVMIDGHEAEAMTLVVEVYRPEYGHSWYFVEEARMFIDGKFYAVQYIYDTMRDDLAYTYDPERDDTDIQEIKQRALTMYEWISINE